MALMLLADFILGSSVAISFFITNLSLTSHTQQGFFSCDVEVSAQTLTCPSPAEGNRQLWPPASFQT